MRSTAKWWIDKVGAALLLIATAPVLALAAAAIKLTSPGPVLYKARLLGRDRRPFVMYKLRTMRPVPGPSVPAPDHEEMGSVFIKPNGNGRVTGVGKWMRRLSVDELPQLVNVLKGDLSLVGPRPIRFAEAKRLPLGLRDPRFRVQQGMTGLWQVSGRSDLPDEERIALDHAYVENWSIGLDLRILFATIGAVLKARGAR